MKAAYPKHPRDIPIRIVHRSVEEGLLCGIATTADVSLGDKLNDYLFRLGYSSAHITGIITQLLTKAKVRVDFREYSERIELKSPNDKLSSAQAMTLLEDFVAEMKNGMGDDTDKKSTTTQHIVVHAPKTAKAAVG